MNNDYIFDHAAQVVPDIAEAIAWYQNLLPNVVVLHQDATWGFIEASGAKIAFVTKDEHPGHLAWRVSQAELERLATVHGKQIKPHRDGTKSFYLLAPGGNGIEVISYEGSEYEANENMPRD